MVWEAISKTWQSVSTCIQTPRSQLKKNSSVPHFFNPLLGVWISWRNTLLYVWYITYMISTNTPEHFTASNDLQCWQESMKEYLNPVVLFMTQGKMVLILTIFWDWGWNPKMFTIHAKAVKQYLNPVVLFIMQYKVVLTFESADKILGCGAVTFSQNSIWEYFRFEQGHSWENTKSFYNLARNWQYLPH